MDPVRALGSDWVLYRGVSVMASASIKSAPAGWPAGSGASNCCVIPALILLDGLDSQKFYQY